MNKLALATLTTLISQATGCIIEARDRDHGPDDPIEVATISASWSLRNMSDGATTRCPTGIDTVVFIAQPIDEAGDPVGDAAVDLFDCDAQRGVATDLYPDVYQTWIEMRSHDRRTLYAQSLSQVLDVRTADDKFETEMLNDGGYFQLQWNLVGKTTNRPLSCAQMGLDKIKTISTRIATPEIAYDDSFACEDQGAVSGGLREGDYTIDIDAYSGTTAVGTAPALATKRILDRNQVTDLGTVVIPIDGL